MLARTHNDVTPWFVVRADDKREARLEVIRHILFPYDEACVSEGRLAP